MSEWFAVFRVTKVGNFSRASLYNILTDKSPHPTPSTHRRLIERSNTGRKSQLYSIASSSSVVFPWCSHNHNVWKFFVSCGKATKGIWILPPKINTMLCSGNIGGVLGDKFKCHSPKRVLKIVTRIAECLRLKIDFIS